MPTVGTRTGDTPADERRRLARNPPDLLITTPESLYLMLTSAARDSLVNVEAVIIDEIHALAATKRGSHLALSLERLEARCAKPPQRIGLSATQRPLEEIATFLGGFEAPGKRRPVSVVDAGMRKTLEIEVVVPVEDMGELGTVIDGPVGGGPAAAGPVRKSIWPAMHPRLLELVQEHRSTLIFVNARRLAERLATRLNELAAEQAEQEAGNPTADGAARFVSAEAVGAPPVDVELVKAHHGSLSRERRLIIEDELKSGRLKGLVATSSLELGIDMGAIDLVIQIESPPCGGLGACSASAAPGTRSASREPWQVVLPKFTRADLVQVGRRRPSACAPGEIEAHARTPANPLDVLAQQVVAIGAPSTS